MILRWIFVVFVVFAIVGAAGSQETTYNVRLLLHSTTPNSSNWKIAGWTILPNVSANPAKILVIAGPRFEKRNWWAEAMGGYKITSQRGTGLLDIRAFYQPCKTLISFSGGISCFILGGGWYTYLDCSYKLPIGSIGVETENNHPNLSWGPHLVVPLNHLTLVGVYQFHKGGDQIWIRSVVNF